MNKLLSALTAGMMVLVMNGFAVAQDAANKPNTPQEGSPSTQQDTQAQPADQAGDSAKQKEYSAALKKCETLSSSQKEKCIDAAKAKNDKQTKQDTQAQPADQSGDVAKEDSQAQPADQPGDIAKQDTQAQPADQSGDVAKEDSQAQPADQSGDVAKQDSQAQPADQAGDSTKEQEYSAALKECETLSSTDKAKCTEAAKKKHGEM